MSEVAIGEFEIVADYTAPPAAAPTEPVQPGLARLQLTDLAAMQRELQERALRLWAD